jgi:hypothetical protein
MSILAVLPNDVADPASSIFLIKRSWPSNGMRGTAHTVRAVHFARWLGGGSARLRGAKPSFHILFPSPPMWRGQGRRCVATAASPPGTELFRRRWSWRGRLLAMKREGQGWLRLSPSPTHVSSLNPSRQRWIFSFPSSLRQSSRSRAIPAASSAASYANFVGGVRPSLLLPGHKDPTMVASSDVELSRGDGDLAACIRYVGTHLVPLPSTELQFLISC